MTLFDDDPRPSFEVLTRPDYFLAPDGTHLDEAWWDEPVPPTVRIPLESSRELIEQINQEGGKQSCYLTAQLNAWILRGQLTSLEAAHFQEVVSQDPQFQRFWKDQAWWDQDYYAWSGRPGDTAWLALRITGRRLAFAIREVTPNKTEQLGEALGQGFAAVFSDDAHSRTVFQPSGSEQVFVHDPKYVEKTGLYVPSKAFELQTAKDFLVI